MKKKLEAELISIAHKILRLGGTADIGQLQQQAKEVYEKLTILNFTETHFKGVQPTIGKIQAILDSTDQTQPEEGTDVKTPALDIRVSEDIPEEKIIDAVLPSFENQIKTPEVSVPEETRPEHIIESINEKVSEDLFVPARTITEENISLSEPVFEKNDAQDVGSYGQSMPVLDNQNESKPKSLNDQLKKGIQIGLNDRLAFIKHLFDGSAEDYNRVLSQLNTLSSKSGAQQFVRNMVKPDYNNWEGKQEYEERFMEIVSNRFEY